VNVIKRQTLYISCYSHVASENFQTYIMLLTEIKKKIEKIACLKMGYITP